MEENQDFFIWQEGKNCILVDYLITWVRSYNFEMNSEESSFREIYEYPSRNSKPLKNKTRHLRKRSAGENQIPVQSFDKFVRKTKNVVMFVQKLKQQIAQKRTFNMHNLTDKEMEYLQNESSEAGSSVFFSCESRFVLIFEAAFAFLLLFFAWKNSFQAVFTCSSQLQEVTLITLAAYLISAVFFCLSEYKNERQQIITNRNLVFQIYLQDHFLKDLIAVIMIIIQASEIDEKLGVFPLFVLLRVGSSILTFDHMLYLVGKLQNRLAVSTNAETMIAICKLLFKIFMFLHFLSIFLNLMADLEVKMGHYDTWINQNSVNGDFDRYIVGWYWGATILSTVGFGDISPNNNIERFFISIVQVFCCMAFGYFVNVIGSLLRLRSQRDQKYQKEARTLNRYLNSLTLSQDLKFKVRNHFMNKHKIEKTYDSGEQKVVLDNLTNPLKRSLLEQNNISVLKTSNYLERFTSETLIKVAQLLKRVIFAPEHIIYSRQTTEQKLWFIESGAVEEFTDTFKESTNLKKIAHYQKDDVTIGWIRFLTEAKYSTQAKASKFTVAYQLESAKFLATIQENTKEWHKLLGIKQLLIENRKRYLQKCLSCDRYSHNVMECPRIHYIKRNVASLVKQEKNIEAYRASHRQKRKFNRQNLRENWKKDFQSSDTLGKANVFQNKHEDCQIGEAIDHFIKNLTKIQSLKQISNKRISLVNCSRGERDSKATELQPKDLYLISKEQQISSLQISDVVEVQHQEFQKVLLDKDCKEYLPDHNIDQVVHRYNQLTISKQAKNLSKLFHFNKK